MDSFKIIGNGNKIFITRDSCKCMECSQNYTNVWTKQPQNIVNEMGTVVIPIELQLNINFKCSNVTHLNSCFKRSMATVPQIAYVCDSFKE